jgi:hypothetical protein
MHRLWEMNTNHYDLESYGIVVTIIPDREEEYGSFSLRIRVQIHSFFKNRS